VLIVKLLTDVVKSQNAPPLVGVRLQLPPDVLTAVKCQLLPPTNEM
jgi:hypothetical protein